MRINWSKIDIITYSKEFMSEECKAEVRKAYTILREYDYRGEKAKAAYIRRRLEEKENFVLQH